MKKKYTYFIVLSIVLTICDQITKEYIERHFQLFESLTVIPRFLYITYIHNKGGAFGIFSNVPEVFRSIFFLVVPIAAIALIFYMYVKGKEDQKIYLLSLILIFSGAVGNITDRVRFNYVRDFIDVDLTWLPLYQQHWPAFNVADSLICIGVVLLIIYSIFFESKLKQKK